MKAIATTLATVLTVAFLASGAFAEESQWAKDHPRRAQVNKRLKNQNKRINDKVKDGQMSKAEAKDLHNKDRMIRQEERDMAKQNGGHITKQEQKVLNQQENAVSREIGK